MSLLVQQAAGISPLRSFPSGHERYYCGSDVLDNCNKRQDELNNDNLDNFTAVIAAAAAAATAAEDAAAAAAAATAAASVFGSVLGRQVN